MMELDNAVAPNVPARRFSFQPMITPGFIVGLATAIGVAAVLSQAGLYLIGHFVVGTNLVHQETAETFKTVSGAVSVAFAARAALALVVLSVLTGASRLLFVLVLFFAADEAVDIHEVVGNGVSAVVGVSPDAAWPAIYAPLLIVAAILILRVLHDGPPVARTAGRTGLACLGLSLVVGLVWVLVRGRGYHGSDRHVVELVTEEGLELLGWCLIAGALAAVAWTRRSRRAPA
jgi:hypothetical protein